MADAFAWWASHPSHSLPGFADRAISPAQEQQLVNGLGCGPGPIGEQPHPSN